jgi:hypothetical protein
VSIEYALPDLIGDCHACTLGHVAKEEPGSVSTHLIQTPSDFPADLSSNEFDELQLRPPSYR